MIVFYSLPKAQQQWVKSNYPKLPVQFKSGKLSLQNLPNPKTEVLSVHTNCKINAQILAKLPALKLIATRTTGVDHIDFVDCKKSKVKVVNAAGMNAQSVAEFAFGLILSASRKIKVGVDRVEKGHFDDADLVGSELAGKTIGVIGAGAIGGSVLRIANGFGMKLLANDAYVNSALKRELKLKYVTAKEIFQKADIISLHVPSTPKTKHMINARTFKLMKPGVGIVNTARGSIVDTQAVLSALKSKKLAWYAADVLEEEHNIFTDKTMGKLNKALVTHDRTIITPHMAHNTAESVDRVTSETLEKITAFLKNKPVQFVS